MGLIIVEPLDGSTVAERFIVVRGLAQPGSTIVRDVPFWFDEITTADSAGRWSFALGLNQGQNVFKFRVGDDLATEVMVTVVYQP